jgi:hypothetical protein
MATLIRKESEAGRLVPWESIGALPSGRGTLPLSATENEALVRQTVEENEDIREVVAEDGSRHVYSTRFMTGAYAAMALKKRGDPRRLIAEVVRQYAADHERPVPLELFTQSPLDLAARDLPTMLETMETEDEFKDIARTVTSTGRLFLYAADRLDPAHAALLAEWLDVGQSENP